MPIQPITVALSSGQKVDVMKRFRKRYGDEMEKIEASITEIMTAVAEAEFMAQYVGEQPEVKELRARKTELEALEARRLYLSKLIDRLDGVIPAQHAVATPNLGNEHEQPQRERDTGLRPALRRY
jgi:hypothetical protein